MAAIGQKSNFLSRLLGLEENSGANGSFGGGNQPLQGQVSQQAVQPQGGWTNTLKSLKLSDAFQGINVTPNFLFLLLFLGFAAWLFVVYWIRHHEPLANSVLGTNVAHSPTAHADRALVAGIKKTLPVRTSHSMGDYYVPIPHANGIAASGDYGYGAAGAYAFPQHAAVPPHHAAVPLPSPPAPQPMPMPAPAPTTPLSYTYNPYTVSSPPQQPYYPQGNAYMVPIQHAAGTRVKMIVNR